MTLKRQYTIIVDTRERKPLLFPASIAMLDPSSPPHSPKVARVSLTTIKRKLDTGDYALLGYEEDVLVERKGSLREISKNCFHFKDRPRFIRCIERLRDSCKRPYVLLEGSPLEMLRPTKEVPKPYFSVDSLLRILTEYQIGFWFMPANTSAHKRAAGEWLARTLINGVI